MDKFLATLINQFFRYGSIKKISQDFISDVKFSGLEGTSFNYKGENINFSLCGKYNLKNALSVISLAEDLGLTPAQIKTGLETVKTIFGRNQIVKKDFTFKIVFSFFCKNSDAHFFFIKFPHPTFILPQSKT